MIKSALFYAAILVVITGEIAISQQQPTTRPATRRSMVASGPNVFESPTPVSTANPLDKIVFGRLSAMGIKPVLCSDAVFVRRAYLDIIGTLPTAKEASDFIDDPDTANKRRLLIDKLLEREEFAVYWAMKWGDILRIKAEFPVNLWPNAAQAYHRWVMASIAQNKPYDQFARELLTSSGSNFRVGPVNFYRAIQSRTPEGTAGAVALTFMGVRTDFWPKEQVAGMSVFFSQIGYKATREWKEEVVFWDPLRPAAEIAAKEQEAKEAAAKEAAEKEAKAKEAAAKAAAEAAAKNPASAKPATKPVAKPVTPAKPATPAAVAPPPPPPPLVAIPQTGVFPDGTSIKLPGNRDPREIFADWLITPKNPWFTRAITNRVWYWLMGRGVIHEPDDIRKDNPPTNVQILVYLEGELVKSKYDLKHLYRLILNSQAYQLSSVPHSKLPQAEANFASYPLRRLDAEVLIDAINSITGATDLYTSAIPEPFTYIPQDMPSIAIADGSITSPFLTLFGRSARATGMENERTNRVVPAQWLHLLNSSHIQRKLDQGPKMKALLDPARDQSEIITDLYLTILSRFPTPDEVKAVEAYGTPVTTAKGGKKTTTKRRDDWVDIAWSLINSTEFLYRH